MEISNFRVVVSSKGLQASSLPHANTCNYRNTTLWEFSAHRIAFVVLWSHLDEDASRGASFELDRSCDRQPSLLDPVSQSSTDTTLSTLEDIGN